jgi:hypothetical protein
VVDIAGLVKGASEGAGLGNTFLSHIREVGARMCDTMRHGVLTEAAQVDAIAHVVRIFEGEASHVDGSIDPIRDVVSFSPPRTGRVQGRCGKLIGGPRRAGDDPRGVGARGLDGRGAG